MARATGNSLWLHDELILLSQCSYDPSAEGSARTPVSTMGFQTSDHTHHLHKCTSQCKLCLVTLQSSFHTIPKPFRIFGYVKSDVPYSLKKDELLFPILAEG